MNEEIGGDPARALAERGLRGLLERADHRLDRLAARFPMLFGLFADTRLSLRGLLLGITGLLLLILLPPFMQFLLRRANRLETNFRGEAIPQSFGLVILVWAECLLLLTAYLFPASFSYASPVGCDIPLWMLTLAGFGLLGFLDDTRGESHIKGLRGHFRALLQDRRMTTGLIKALGGVGLAFWIGHRIHPGASPGALAAAAGSALLIALSANAVNLLDLRPGRAGAIFLAAGLLLLLVSFHRAGLTGAAYPLLCLLIPACVVWERDARATVMLGDTGSNMLGAALGLAFAQLPCRPGVHLAAIVLLVLLHAVAERVSLTQFIEGHPILRALDRCTGVR